MSNKNYLNMSDEDMLNADAPEPEEQETQEEDNEQEEQSEEDTQQEEQETKDDVEDSDDPDAAVDSQESDENDSEDSNVDNKNKESSEDAEDLKGRKADEVVDKSKTEKTAEVTETPINYEAEYKKLLTPFKANGRDVEVKSVDDAITLMQMGANYNKKMAALKPNLKVLKLLENNGLLNEEKIGFLIDLEKKNPDAITKLVKDSGLDPLEIDTEQETKYKPQVHDVDDRELMLDAVIDEIKDTPAYSRTINVVGTEWDSESKKVVAENPQLLQIINDHISRGIYDTIHTEVDRQRMLGRLNGLSDLEAYRQVGDAIQAQGGFNSVPDQQEKTPAGTVVLPKSKKVDDDKLKEKKRAASSSKPGVVASNSDDFNPLAMPDEEFAKMADSRFR